jgi:hypothetical protein
LTSPAQRFIDRLRSVDSLEFTARSDAATGWDGGGSGLVSIESNEAGTVIFREAGVFTPAHGRPLDFRNIYRWTLHGTDAVRLDHLRRGQDQPVHLFDLSVSAGQESTWASREPHRCAADRYSARCEIGDGIIELHWRIIGPRKNETIDYQYRSGRAVAHVSIPT